jgi:hypothetical protein
VAIASTRFDTKVSKEIQVYHLKVIREGKMTIIQIGCVERMRELTIGMIEYALDRDEFHSFEKSNYEVWRDDADKERSHAYVDEVAEYLATRKKWEGYATKG